MSESEYILWRWRNIIEMNKLFPVWQIAFEKLYASYTKVIHMKSVESSGKRSHRDQFLKGFMGS